MSIQSYVQIDSPDPLSAPDLTTKRYVDAANTSLRVPYARYFRAAALSFAAGTVVNPFIYDTKGTGSDPNNNYSGGIYTCPINGLYFVRASVSVGQTAAGSVTVRWQWNGADNLFGQMFQSVGTTAIIAVAEGVILVSAGDTLQVGAASSVANPCRAIASETNMQIVWLAGGAV